MPQTQPDMQDLRNAAALADVAVDHLDSVVALVKRAYRVDASDPRVQAVLGVRVAAAKARTALEDQIALVEGRAMERYLGD